MKYLVLRKFKSYGVFYTKGDIVEAEAIRNPRLKLAEGKIVCLPDDTAVFSSPKAAASLSAKIEETANEVSDSDTAAAAVTSEEKHKSLFVVKK